MSTRRIAITGMGAVSGYGRGVDALWQGLCSGGTAVRQHHARFRERAWVSYPMASLPWEPDARGLPNPQFVRDNHLHEDPDFLAIADAVDQALGDAGLSDRNQRAAMGLVVTHESPGLAPHVKSFFRFGKMLRAWWNSRSKFNPPDFLYEQQADSVYRLHSFLYLHYLSALFGMHGFTLYNNNACASGIFSVAVAADRIRSGEAEAIVVVGGDVPQDGTKYRWFRDLGLYSLRGICDPFQADRDGMILGSGAAALVLEDYDKARAAGKHIHAEWLGGGYTSDGWKVTLPDVVDRRYAGAMHQALKSAGVRAEEISLIVPHGVGSGLYDRFEATCLAEVFGDDGRPWPPMMPLKGAFGHTLGGCALLETIPAILAMKHATIPASVRFETQDPTLPLGEIRQGGLPGNGLFMKCTNGFAGQNGAMILRTVFP